MLIEMVQELEEVIGDFVNNLLKLRRHYKGPNYSRWFNGDKKMCIV